MKHDLSWLYGAVPDLTRMQRLKLRMFGNVYIGSREHAHGKVALYIVHCPKHGNFVDIEHGWFGHFQCPECINMRRAFFEQY